MASKRRRKCLKIILITMACLIGIPIVLFAAILYAVTIPSVQQKAVTKAAQILSEQTGIEVSVGHFSVRPPFNLLLKDVFVAGEQNDTLAFVGCLDARLNIKTLPDSISVNSLLLSDVVAHSGDLISSLKIDGRIGKLEAGVKSFNIKEFYFPITDAVLEDADIALELSESQADEEAPADSSSASIIIDLQNLSLKNVAFRLEPTGLALNIGKAATSTLLDLGATCFTVHDIDLSNTFFKVGGLELPVERFSGDALVDIGNEIISSKKAFISIPQMNAEATLYNSSLSLDKMLVSTTAKANYAGSLLSLKADYDIDDEIFEADVDISRTNLAEILKISGSEIIAAGNIKASGRGIDPTDPRMSAELFASLDSCRYNNIDISGVELAVNLSDGSVSGSIASPVHFRDTSISADLKQESNFSIRDFLSDLPGIKLKSKIKGLDARMTDEALSLSEMDIDFKTDNGFSDISIEMPGINLSANTALHALEIPSAIPSLGSGKLTPVILDSLIAGLPPVNAELKIDKDNPLSNILTKKGFDLNKLSASLHSSPSARNISLHLDTPDLDGQYKIPALNANLEAVVKSSSEGVNLDGTLKLKDLAYAGKKLGDRKLSFEVRPDSSDPDHLVAHANLDDIPLGIAEQFVELPEDIGIKGDIRARLSVTGLPEKADIFAAVKPVAVEAEYKPYDVKLNLGEEEITMEDGKIKLNGLRIIASDSSSVNLTGGMDLSTMQLDVKLKSDCFEPVKLPQDGPIPVYGRLLTKIDGSISGPLDSMKALINVGILPQTDITYPIDKKNLAQVNPEGTIEVGYTTQEGLDLGGQIDIPSGKIFFSPKLYPMMPFSVDKGSCVKFNGSIDSTTIAISASQKAKATYKPVGEVSRMVDFITGVKVGGSLSKFDIGFYLDAPKDKEIQQELALMPQEDREGLAAVLLATGMYASESNEAAQMEGYALSSIVQSKLNAAVSNKWGNKVNIDFGVAKGKHGRGVETTDYTLNISKSFFNDKLNIKVGGSVSDNAEVNKNSGSFINNLSAEYKLDTTNSLKARIFSLKDFNNIVDGELIKSGVGVLYNKTLDRQRDSLDRSLDLEVEGNLVYRSNNQLGPDAAVTLSKNNLFSRNDIFTTKVKGSYFWNLNKKEPKDPSRNDTYILGVDFSLNFPYLQLGDAAQRYIGQTLYRIGYLKENISGDYGLQKIYGGLDYSLRQNKYITHSFSPAYLSVVLADKVSEKTTSDLSLTDLLKLFANNEFIPSARYAFSYNNYRDKNRTVRTALDFQVKESANLISGILAACGQDFNKRDKKLLGVNYDQFVKLQFELRNRFSLSERLELATRAFAGAVITYGNSVASPLSEAFSIGGPNSLRAFSPRSIGPGDFRNDVYSSQIFHTGDIKFELNAELRFPIFWKINGAVFVDAGNVWNQRDPKVYMTAEEIEACLKGFNLPRMYDSHISADTFLNQIALGTGAGLRLDYESIVIRLDLGIAIHAPFDTGLPGYYNIPNFWKNGMKFNFGIGYPF